MKARLIKAVAGGVLVFAGVGAQSSLAQTSAAPAAAPAARPAPAPLASPNPHYDSVVMEIDVNRPAGAVWARVGKFCDIGEWFGTNCKLTSGTDGQLGAVRDLNNGAVLEILVSKTDLSYSYAQPPRVGQFYALYHGTLEAKPVTAKTSKLVYSLFFDNSNLPDDAARERDRANRRTRFMQGLSNMKILAEGGTLPPRQPPAAPAAPAPR